ncbi:hypothetical protein [Leptospira noguchii]|uniref:hypothetical protein n=1 Tax=Leptospira noguchii TaxID=28182 RepID=UPI0002BEA7FF|nr:hypothetical protein [Leptospira noguchii]EMI60493.1 hypothetical protein LEP1GSC072_2408 [Leptospira noguchii str. Bonito]
MADTNTNELKIVFTIADLASSKINEINGKWDSMRQLIGENKKYSEQFKKSVQEVDSSFMSMKRGFAILDIGVSIAKTCKDLYDARTESLKLEKNLQSLGLSVKEVGDISKSAFQLSDETGIPVETILASVNKIKSLFKSLNSSDLNALVGTVANATLATGGNFSDLIEQLISTGKQVKNFNADINQLDFSNITDFQLSSEKMNSFPFQFNRASESWNNFKKILGKGIEDSALVKFGIIESVLKNIFRTLADGIGKVNMFLGENPKLAEFAGTFFMLGGGILFGAGALIILKSVALGLFAALKVAVMSNPIGLAVVGIVAALALIITYWDDIKTTAVKTWNWIVNTWSNLSGFGKLLVVWFMPIVGIPLMIYENWDKIKNIFSSIGTIIAKAFSNIYPYIQPIINAPSWIVSAWNSLVNFFEKLVDSIFSIFSNLPSGIQEILVLAMVNPIFGLYSLIWQALSNVIGNIRNRMKDSGKSLFTAFSEGILDSIADLKSTIHDVMQIINRYLPHSNALEGPLSRLTDSGSAFIDTFILGMKQKSNTLVSFLREMSNGFKSGLNFIQESGTKTVTTFSEGISSGKSVVYNKVIDVLEKTKRLFPNSDAKEGPFSTLTKSGRATVAAFSSGMESEIPKINPILQRFNQVLTTDSKGIIKRTLENKENSEVISGKSNITSNTNIGSVIGQLVIGNKTMDKKKIGEMITDAIFQELDRFEEMELI